MNLKRTDLALEVHEINSEKGKDDGIVSSEKNIDGVSVTVVRIKEGKGEELTGKKAGVYITADIGKIWHASRKVFEKTAYALSKLIEELLPENNGNGCTLVVGLGNKEITADAIGPLALEKVIASRHIKELNRDLYDSIGFGSTAALITGVIGQTGIESAEIIKSVVDTVKPDCVIIIDALASRRISRLATTVQISDTGIAPGAGVENKRKEINSETLGVPVISVGVPTVVDAATLVSDVLEECNADAESSIDAFFNEKGKNFFVTLKESDVVIKETARLLSTAVNLALHKNIGIDDIAELV